MADPEKIADIDRLVSLLHVSFNEYAALIADRPLPRAASA